MLDEELRLNDPDLNDRCGLLDSRYEVYAATIPQMIHGAVGVRSACRGAQRLATEHRRLKDPVWE